ncbi:unnamed protein product [Lampetra planeri]
MALDDRALAAFQSIPPADRATFPMAYAQRAAIFELPSSACLNFSSWRQEEAKTSLAFHSSLLALAQAAYPTMDGAVLDSLALERLLSLVRELGVVLAIDKEADISSLRVAQGIQAHLALWQLPIVVACTGVPGPAGAGTPEGEDGLAAFTVGDQHRKGAGGHRPEQR